MSEFDDNYNDDYEWQQQREEFQKFEKNASRYMAEKQAKAAQQDQQAIFQEALAASGLTLSEYNTLVNADPAFVRNVYADHVKSLVQTVKTRRDPQTGQFVKQGHQVAPKVPHREPAPNQKIESLREKSKTQSLSHEDELDVIDALFPNGL